MKTSPENTPDSTWVVIKHFDKGEKNYCRREVKNRRKEVELRFLFSLSKSSYKLCNVILPFSQIPGPGERRQRVNRENGYVIVERFASSSFSFFVLLSFFFIQMFTSSSIWIYNQIWRKEKDKK